MIATANLPSWVNTGKNDLPAWLMPHVVEQRGSNGCFVIETPMGRHQLKARVAVGNTVVLHEGAAFTRDADGIGELIASFETLDASNADLMEPDNLLSRTLAPANGRKQPYAPPIGVPPTPAWIPVEMLSIDAEYQRSTDNDASQRLIKSIAAKFDWRLCSTLTVSRRPDGTMTVIDGQHRTLAVKLRGDIPHLPCCVFSYSGTEEEAKMFIAANRSRKPMNRLDDFHAALVAGDELALQIQRLVKEAGLSVTRNTSSTAWKPGEIAFTASIASTLRKYGPGIVSAALTDIAEAFPDQKVIHSGSIFLGLVKVLTSPPADFDPDRLFQALLRYSADEWGSFVTGLKGGDTRATAIRDALLMAYDEVSVPADNLVDAEGDPRKEGP